MSKAKKERVTDLSIIVQMIKDKPYYEVKYRNVGESDYKIGYSSYDLKTVLEFIDKYFEVVDNNSLSNADRIRNMSDKEMTNFFFIRGGCKLCAYHEQSMACLNVDNSCEKGIEKWLKSKTE